MTVPVLHPVVKSIDIWEAGDIQARFRATNSVNVLFNGNDVVDVLLLGFDVEFVDYNSDGNIDLKVHNQCVFEKQVTHYEITPNGFNLVTDDEVAE